MAPRKPAAAAPNQPLRRSARIASRSPSVEPEDNTVSKKPRVKARVAKSRVVKEKKGDKKIKTPEPKIKTPEPKPMTPEPKINTPEPTIKTPEIAQLSIPVQVPDSLLTMRLRNRNVARQIAKFQTSPASPESGLMSTPPTSPKATKIKINRTAFMMNMHRVLAEETAKKAAAPPATPAPASPAGASPEARAAVEGPVAASSPPPSTSAQGSARRAGLMGLISTISGYVTTPFSRKRSADEPAEEAPSPKRSRQSGNDTTAPAVGEGAAPGETPEPEPAQKPALEAEQEPTTPQQATAEHESESATGETPVATPKPTRTPGSGKNYTGPSSKNPQMPTSLSTITEYTEPSTLSSFSESLLTSTPSKAPRAQPSRGLLQAPQVTPIRKPTNTPGTMRRSAQLRAARAARDAGGKTPVSSFAARAAAMKPVETNADARLAKMERYIALQKELEELQQDTDIQEIESHRVKRVKIDNLVQIPHNRPGDPSGCFRMPEEDSDDEMEVYASVEEKSNLFEEANTPVPTVPAEATITEPLTTEPAVGAAVEDISMHEGTTVDGKLPEPRFAFPDVGPRSPGDEISAENKALCGLWFAEGFAAWQAEKGVPSPS